MKQETKNILTNEFLALLFEKSLKNNGEILKKKKAVSQNVAKYFSFFCVNAS